MFSKLKSKSSLSDYIKNSIEKNGPMTIAQYMSIILYHKSIGYYVNREIGEDFVTSPELSKSFGNLIAMWFYEIYIKSYHGEEIIFIELGPGNGSFSHSILKIFMQIPKFCEKVIFYMVENSHYLTSKQQKKLHEFSQCGIKINWVKDLGLININKPAFFFSNEFFDCLPVNQFFCSKCGLKEILVNFSKYRNEFYLSLDPRSSIYSYLIEDKSYKINDILEISASSINTAKFINNTLMNYRGISLIIDYGDLKKTKKSSLQIAYKNKNTLEVNFIKNILSILQQNCLYLIKFLKKLSRIFESYRHCFSVFQKLSTLFLNFSEVINIFSRFFKNYRHFIKFIKQLLSAYTKLLKLFKICLKFINKNNRMYEFSQQNIDYITKNLDCFDISTHVDFGNLIKNMPNCKSILYTQKDFLKKLGFDKLRLDKSNKEYTKITLNYLDKSDEDTSMGMIFKVLFSELVGVANL